MYASVYVFMYVFIYVFMHAVFGRSQFAAEWASQEVPHRGVEPPPPTWSCQNIFKSFSAWARSWASLNFLQLFRIPKFFLQLFRIPKGFHKVLMRLLALRHEGVGLCRASLCMEEALVKIHLNELLHSSSLMVSQSVRGSWRFMT